VVGSSINETTFWELWNKEGTAAEQYNPNDQNFRNRGVVTGGHPNQIAGGYQAPQQQYSQPQQRQQIEQGTLKVDDFNFEEAHVIKDKPTEQAPQQVPPQQVPPQQVPPQQVPQQAPQQVPPQGVNPSAEQANQVVDTANKFFNNSTDFKFDD
jgi:hypothetical protein